MQVKFIDRDTRFDIRFIKNGETSDLAYSGSFYNTEGDLIVLIEGKEFFEYCSNAFPGFLMEITFFMRAMKYTFRAEYLSVVTVNRVSLVRVEVKTVIEEISRRSLPRIELSVMAKVYITTSSKMEYAYDAMTVDISLDAVSLISTIMIPPGEHPDVFSIGLVLGRSSFMLPSKLIRESPYFGHEKFFGKYIFAMDFSADKELKDKLLFALFEYKKRR